jgi:hypothetical protein
LEEIQAEKHTPVEVPATVVDDNAPVTIRVESYRPNDVPTIYSDGMVVIHTANEFVLSFLQTEFPLAATTQDLRQVESMKRRCIVQIIVSPSQAELMLKALQENMNQYINVYRKPQNDEHG